MLERIFSVALIIVLLPCASLHAAKDKPYIEELKKLDAVLEQKSIYGQYLMDRVGILRSVLAEQSSPAQRFSVNMRIAKEFMSYRMDSTMHYLSVCRKIAVSEGDAGKVLETDMRTAEEYLLAGYHLEASEIMHGIVPEDVPQGPGNFWRMLQTAGSGTRWLNSVHFTGRNCSAWWRGIRMTGMN